MIENAGDGRERIVGRVALNQNLNLRILRNKQEGNSAVSAEFHSSLSNTAEFCRFRRKLAVICSSRDVRPRVGPPDEPPPPPRPTLPRTPSPPPIPLNS